MAPTESDCLFCGIIAGRIPADVVGESEQTLAFRDLNPQAPTHVLIVPRQHYATAAQAGAADAGLLDEIARVAGEVATAEGIADTGYRLVFNTGPAAGQTVLHVHGHLLGGRGLEWPPG
ncbi:histidine triad nucleotide-binding protein [Nocardiopsis ansamitocini]|uniref:Histidine triad nucleotide-binding protein n=1 Tax=Nocardiopsis ansamitocini TaxID=1670832 RepID=A0A9W6P3F2_9ACTN|nr:histidine triad nucleotide-binding protein [Nocardiopsis ansamitocini]GLU46371.1 histidine triad nucleotide-binding protein [Nocardiopsis ansamitocini]